MNQKNTFNKTPQFIQFINQCSTQSKGDYAQIFISKNTSSSLASSSKGGFENTDSTSQKSSSDSSSLPSASKYKQVFSNSNSPAFQNGNEQIQAQWMKNVENLNKQTEQQNQQNLLKRGKQQVDKNQEEIPNDSLKDYQEMQNQQLNNPILEQKSKNVINNQGQQSKQQKSNQKKSFNPSDSKQGESVESLNERLKLHQQLMMLPKNERNKALLSQKKRDERWDKQPITHKQVTHFSKSQTEDDKKKAIQEILANHEVKQNLKYEKKQQEFVNNKEKTEQIDSLISQLNQSGEVKIKKEKKQIKQELINEILEEKLNQKNTKQTHEKKSYENGHSIKGVEVNNDINGLKRHKEKQKNKKYSDNQKSDEEYHDDLTNGVSKDSKNSKQKNKRIDSNTVHVSASDKLADFIDHTLVNSQKNKQQKQKKYQDKPRKNNQNDDYELEKEILRQEKYQNQNKSNQNNNKRTFQSFEPYWSSEEIEKAIQTKKAFKGVYSSNEKNQYLGRLRCDEIEGLIFVNSHKDQNRSLHNCVVGFIIISGDPSSRLKKNTTSDDSSLKKLQSENLMDDSILNKSDDKEIDETEEDWETGSDDSIPQIDQSKLVAKIVYIFENPYKGDKIVGYLQEFTEEKSKRSQGKGKKKYWFIPKFTRLPKMIPVEFSDEFQHQVEENNIDITTQYVVGKMQEWKADSFYPLVTISECIGSRGDIEIECDTLLKEFGVYNEDFTPQTEDYLTKYRAHLNENGEYIIPESEKKIRWDLTNGIQQFFIVKIICTIDPPDAKDLDDALSVKHLHDDIYEIGVHIADVSHFVQPNTPLDDDARLRTTSVYLVHRVIPMLPRLLCENLCSLNPYVERLAFSVFFQMKDNGEVLWDGPIRIGKSIIKSCNKFSYDVVQQMIEKKIKTPQELPEKNQPREGIDKQKMFDSVLLLSKLGMKRREKRFENGVLSVESIKKRFRLDENLWPIDFSLEERKEANFVVEEFMLLANQIIGKAMVDSCKSLAVLRQHCYPSVEKQRNLNEVAKKFGHQVDFASLESINQSIDKIKHDTKLSFEKKLFLKKQMFIVLEQALYFVADKISENEWRHFALNFDIYTHFTSPIRRYPDLLVHRVMFAILQFKQDATKTIDQKSLLSIMDQCNTNKAKAKQVSDNCQKIFMCLYLKDHCVESKAMVISFGATSMTVFIPDHEVQRSVYFQDYKDIIKQRVEKDKEGNKLVIIYKTKKMSRPHSVTFYEYSPITVSLTSTDTFPIDFKVKITLPDADDKRISHIIE